MEGDNNTTEINDQNGVETKTQKAPLFRVLASERDEKNGTTKTISAMPTGQGCIVEVKYTDSFKIPDSEEEHETIHGISLLFVPAVKIVEQEDGSLKLA